MRQRSVAACVLIGLLATIPSNMAAAQPQATASPALPTLVAWSQRVFHDFDRVVTYPTGVFGRSASTGVVAVKFKCSESGAPAEVAIMRSSGHRELDRAALHAVRRIATLHPLPSGMLHEQKIVMRVLFATSPDMERQEMAKIRAEAERSNAWFGASSKVAGLQVLPVGG